jgi:lipoate-protein ligase A
VTTLRETLGAVPANAELGEALVAGVRDVLGVEIAPGSLDEDERARAGLLAGERYGHTRWTVGRDRSLPTA